MMARQRRWLAAAAAGLALTAAMAQEAVGPGLDFLEYLGAWEDSDEEWLAITEWEDEAAPERARPDRSGEEPGGESNDEADDEVDDAN